MSSDEISKYNSNAIVWDGLDEAIIGVCSRINSGPLLVITNDDSYEVDFFDNDDDDLDETKPYINTFSRKDFGPVVLYDTNKIIEILMVDMEVDESELEEGYTIDDLKREMAYEYFYYNIDGGFVGEFTPIHLLIEEY